MSLVRVGACASVVLVCLALLPAGAAAGSDRNFGVGAGRHYGGRGLWFSQSLIGPFDATAAAGYFGNKHGGWEVGVQAVSGRLANRWILRGTLQYGTYARVYEYEYGALVDRTTGEGWGLGGGIGVRAGERQWFVLDFWDTLSSIPASATWISKPPVCVSFGFVVGAM
jgi:hypothetical protein